MRRERFGTQLATSSDAALRHFENAVFRVLAHRPQVEVELIEAISVDPGCVGAWALRGLCHVFLARMASVESARQHLATAMVAMEHGPASADERALVSALQVAAHGGLRRAAEQLEDQVQLRPQLVLFAKLAQALRFMAGDRDQLTIGVESVLRGNRRDADGMGFMIGCLAFSHEERGDFAQAEELGLLALSMERDDAWAMHAISHVYEMTGRSRDGLMFIEACRPVWGHCNNFSLHMSWHAALFQIEQRRFGAVLQIFDEEVWPRASEDFRDISNAVSLLHRLESVGIDVGTRWQGVADAAAAHRHDRTYTFASLHNLIALLAAGRMAEASDLMAAMDRPAAPGNDQEQVLRKVGRPLARLLFDSAKGRPGSFDPAALLASLPSLGGSAAQRDLFLRVLAEQAAGRGDSHALDDVLKFRRQLKTDDLFAQIISYHQNIPVRHIA